MKIMAFEFCSDRPVFPEARVRVRHPRLFGQLGHYDVTYTGWLGRWRFGDTGRVHAGWDRALYYLLKNRYQDEITKLDHQKATLKAALSESSIFFDGAITITLRFETSEKALVAFSSLLAHARRFPQMSEERL